MSTVDHASVARCDCGGSAADHHRSPSCACGCRLDPPCVVCGALTSKHAEADRD